MNDGQSNLMGIIKVIGSYSSGVQRKLLIARVSLRAGVDLTKINESTPHNPNLEERLIKIASEILNVDLNHKLTENKNR